MIIKALLDLIYNILSLLFVFDLPNLPDSVTSVATSISSYITTGISVIRAFVGSSCMSLLGVLLGLIIALNVAYFLYSFVFWVIRKIPMLNVRE